MSEEFQANEIVNPEDLCISKLFNLLKNYKSDIGSIN